MTFFDRDVPVVIGKKMELLGGAKLIIYESHWDLTTSIITPIFSDSLLVMPFSNSTARSV